MNGKRNSTVWIFPTTFKDAVHIEWTVKLHQGHKLEEPKYVINNKAPWGIYVRF